MDMESDQPEPPEKDFTELPIAEYFSSILGFVPNPKAREEWMQDCAFPLTEEVAALLRDRRDPLAQFAGMTAEEITEALRNRFVFADHPFLTEFAVALLGVRLSHLTLLKSFTPESTSATSYPGSTSSYLSFSDGDVEFHIPGGRVVSRKFRDRYPFEKVPGLLEFFENFGGMVAGNVPPGACFASSAKELLVVRDDSSKEWGDIGNWDGSLVWYYGASGDMIIFHPDGTAGVLCHEYSDEQRTWPVGMSFPELLGELRKFLLKDAGEDNPFYY